MAERIDDLKLHEIALGDGAVLETGCVYIVPLIESLALPDSVAAAANPKSSTGRLDVFTRVIADETRGFDMIDPAAITVRSMPRSARARFRCWCARLAAVADPFPPRQCAARRKALARLHARERLVDDDDADVGEGIAVERRSRGLGPTALSATAPSATPA